MSWEAAFAPFARIYEDRAQAGLSLPRRVGCIGGDVPFELVEACGWNPVRLAPTPGMPTPDGDRFIGGGGDGDTRTLFQMLIDGSFGRLDRLVIAHDFEALPRLYYALREFRRRWPERAAALPEPEFLDILHLPRESTRRYNRERLAQLREALGGCDDSAILDAIRARNAVRSALLALRKQRAPGRVSGSEALHIHAAAFLRDPATLLPLLNTLLAAAAERDPLAGTRTFLTGSPHDHPLTYEALEEGGLLIVGEDHDWGDRGNEAPVADDGDPLDALARRYGSGTPAAAKFSIHDRAAYSAAQARECGAELVLAFIRQHDSAPRWDVPDQQAAVAPIRFLMLDDQPWDTDPAILRAELSRQLEQET